MRTWSKNNLVFISEDKGSHPKDFICVWKKTINRTFYKGSPSEKTDCIYIHNSLTKRYPGIFKELDKNNIIFNNGGLSRR